MKQKTFFVFQKEFAVMKINPVLIFQKLKKIHFLNTLYILNVHLFVSFN